MKWNQTTIDCYERQMICKGCSLEEICERYRFKFKKTVLKTFAENGKPPKEKLFANMQQEDLIKETEETHEMISDEKTTDLPKLGKRDLKIIECLCRGLSHNEISEELEIKADTLYTYISVILKNFNHLISYEDGKKKAQFIEYAQRHIFPQYRKTVDYAVKEPKDNDNALDSPVDKPVEYKSIPAFNKEVEKSDSLEQAFMKIKVKYEAQITLCATHLGFNIIQGLEQSEEVIARAIKIKEKIDLLDEIGQEMAGG